jgi:hypothetical protein
MERIKQLALGDDEKFVRSETLFANAAPILIHQGMVSATHAGTPFAEAVLIGSRPNDFDDAVDNGAVLDLIFHLGLPGRGFGFKIGIPIPWTRFLRQFRTRMITL